MKKFRFKYSVSVWLLMVAIIALSGAGLVWNVLSTIEYAALFPIKAVASGLSALLCGVLLAFAISVATYGKYYVKGENLCVKFGFITVKTPVQSIYQFTHFKKSDKLIMYFEDGKYTVIVIAPEQYADFILTVRAINPRILYNSKIDGEDTPD